MKTSIALTLAILAGLLATGCNDSSSDNRDQSNEAFTTINHGPVLGTNDLADLGLFVWQAGSNNVLVLDIDTLEPLSGIKPIVVAQDGSGNVLAVSLIQIPPEPEPEPEPVAP